MPATEAYVVWLLEVGVWVLAAALLVDVTIVAGWMLYRVASRWYR